MPYFTLRFYTILPPSYIIPHKFSKVCISFHTKVKHGSDTITSMAYKTYCVLSLFPLPKCFALFTRQIDKISRGRALEPPFLSFVGRLCPINFPFSVITPFCTKFFYGIDIITHMTYETYCLLSFLSPQLISPYFRVDFTKFSRNFGRAFIIRKFNVAPTQQKNERILMGIK